MNRDMYLRKLQRAIPASLFVALEGLSAVSAMAGDGVVVLQREVPVRPAIREGNPGRATSVDVSPDDKVKAAVNGSKSSLKSTELGDAEFATVSTGTPQALGTETNGAGAIGLSKSQLGSYGLNGAGGAYGSGQSLAPGLTGTVGSTVGGATGNIVGGITGVTSALSGLTGAVMRTGGQ